MPIETVDAAGSRRGAELLLDVLRSEACATSSAIPAPPNYR